MKKLILFFVSLMFATAMLLMIVNAEKVSFGDMQLPIEGMEQDHLFGDEEQGSSAHCDGWYASNKGGENNVNCAQVELTYELNGTTKTVIYPTYYILANNSTLEWDFAPLSEYLGVELNVGNINRIQIPYGITEIGERAFVLPGAFEESSEEHPLGHVAVPNTVLTYVYIPNTVLTIGDFAFAHCTSLSSFVGNSTDTATGNHDHQMVQSIGYRAFHDCPLTSFIFNNHLVYLGEGAFEGCRMTEINLSKCVELKVIPKHCFHESEEYVSNVKKIKLTLSNSIERVEDGAFEGLHFETVYLGTSLKFIGDNALSSDKISLLVIPVTVVADANDPNREYSGINENAFTMGSNSTVVIIAGPYTEAEAEMLSAELERCGGKIGSYDGTDLISQTEKYFRQNPNACVELFGGHKIDANSTNITNVVYENGIGHAGVAYGGSCGICLAGTTETALTPIIVSKGYSVCMFNGLYAISNGFEIYHDALFAYESVHGDCELGIVFLLNDYYESDKDIRNDIASMGVCLNESAVVNETGASFSTMDYVLTYSKGLTFEVENADGTVTKYDRGADEIVIAAYMLHKDGNSAGTSHYLQDEDDLCIAGKTNDGKYYTVSYNSVFGMVQSQGLE